MQDRTVSGVLVRGAERELVKVRFADEDRAGIADAASQPFGVGARNLEVLGRERVGERERGFEAGGVGRKQCR